MRTLTIAGVSALLALGASVGSAQPVISAKSGVVSSIDGAVYLGEEKLESSLTKFPEVKENSVLRTEEGRAQVLLNMGVVMHLGEHSSFRMVTNRLIDTRIELLTGSAIVSAMEVPKDTSVTVVCKDGTVVLGKTGHYRFDAEPARLKVFAGLANVERNGEHVQVSSGKMLSLGSDSASIEKFDKEDTDSLDNWARRQQETMAMANVSAARSLRSGGSYSGSGMSGWNWNPYFGVFTYIPSSGRYCDPLYGYCYWSPNTVRSLFYQPPPMMSGTSALGAGPSYRTMGASAGGYSGTVVSSPSMVSAPAAAASSSASSAASSAGSSSVGHGSAGGGGRGR